MSLSADYNDASVTKEKLNNKIAETRNHVGVAVDSVGKAMEGIGMTQFYGDELWNKIFKMLENLYQTQQDQGRKIEILQSQLVKTQSPGPEDVRMTPKPDE